MRQCPVNPSHALLLLVTLFGCGTPPDLRLEVSERGLTMSATTPSTTASASSTQTASSTPGSIERPAEASSFTAEQLESLTAELRGPRVFRHVRLGRGHNNQQRESWMLSEDGQRLTVACEHGDPVWDDKFLEPTRSYLLSSASFIAVDPAPAQTWATRYRRGQIGPTPNPFPGQLRSDSYRPSQRGKTLCDALVRSSRSAAPPKSFCS